MTCTKTADQWFAETLTLVAYCQHLILVPELSQYKLLTIHIKVIFMSLARDVARGADRMSCSSSVTLSCKLIHVIRLM